MQGSNEPIPDRHRGGGHPPTPATPPCVRVRTRRFEIVKPNSGHITKAIRDHESTRWLNQYTGRACWRETTDRDYSRPWNSPRLRARRAEAASPAGGVAFSIAATDQREGAGEPSESVGLTLQTFHKTQSRHANPAYRGPALPSFEPSLRLWCRP